MIYFFHGSDVEKVRSKAFEWVAKARAKEPNLVYVRLAREELTPEALEDATHSGGLFVSRLLILLDDPFPPARVANEDDDAPYSAEASKGKEDANVYLVEEWLDKLATSDNAIIILAPKLATAKAKKIVAKAKLEYKFDLRDGASLPAGRQGFNSSLVDALGARSRERLWLEIHRALYLGDVPEQLVGLLHWKARDLMSKGSRAWKPQESRQLSLKLIGLLQESRRGGLGLGVALERWVLSIVHDSEGN